MGNYEFEVFNFFLSSLSLQQICALLRVCVCTEVFLFTVKKGKNKKMYTLLL